MEIIGFIMKNTENIGKKIIIATIKGAVGTIPVAGPFLSEYIGLTTEIIASKRLDEWQNMVEHGFSRQNMIPN